MTNGIQFNRLIIKNFLSFGNTPTEVNLKGNSITAVLGLNHDTGGDESRNGVGKSAILDAVSYAIYGKTVRGISNPKLVNKLARKGQGMLATLEFSTPKGFYRIERGEAPAKLRLFKKDIDDENDILLRDGKTFVYDVSRNKAETNSEIEKIIGFDIKLFEFLIANTSESIPFMKLEESKKREIAERLMGLNILTERAEELKEDRKVKKKDLIASESAIEATVLANARVQKQIDQIAAKEAAWEDQRKENVKDLREKIAAMSGVDLEEQEELLTIIDELEETSGKLEASRKEITTDLREANRDVSDLDKEIERNDSELKKLEAKKEKILSGVCPTCAQSWVPDESVIVDIDAEINSIDMFFEEAEMIGKSASATVKELEAALADIVTQEEELATSITEVGEFEIHFDSLSDLAMAEKSIADDKAAIEALENSENPHTETLIDLKENALTKIDDSEIKDIRTLIDHYNYLIELLQSKDSFLRKAVIDRWLPKLNSRIAHYLSVLELPYKVRLENDLGMSIKDFGEDFDWGNLSKGQRQRVTIALNFAFQDLFEATNQPLSLLFLDEIIDSGICARGASQAVKALRDSCESKNKKAFLITHRDDIADQLTDTMIVEMRNRISTIPDNFVDEEFDE